MFLSKYTQKQPSASVLRKKCSKNIQQIYMRSPMPKFDFKKLQRNFREITPPHGCSPVNFLYTFRTPFPKNTFGGLLLYIGNSIQ